MPYGFGYGEDAKQQMLDDAREAREQDEANAAAYEERMMRTEINKATAMLFRGGVLPIRNADVDLLAREIMDVAAELAGPTGDAAFWVTDAARELERKIGDIHALPGYMGVLRAAAPRSAA
jgi:hypothetical protein